MGHKVHPYGFRVGISEPWRSRWYVRSRKEAGQQLIEDRKIRALVRSNDKCRDAAVSRVEIERLGDQIRLLLFAARPGALVGRKGVRAGQLEEDIAKMTAKRVEVIVRNIENVMLDSQLVSDSVVGELQRRMPYKRIMHKYAENILAAGAKGVKIQCKGRLGGAEIARHEVVYLGKVPMTTLMAEIDYATSTAFLTKGTIGVKVWIYKRDRRIEKGPEAPAAATAAAPAAGR